MSGFVLVSDPDVPPGMLVVKQGGRIVGAICRGAVFGTDDINRLWQRVIEEMRAAPPLKGPQ